ncbi:restriction endonuclease subunit S [Gloeobacter kilaueensis]|nr:restriction endonuclease subunit S [Gloeobacter kilaueensis]
MEKERKAALMQHLFTYGTRSEPTKQTEVGEIPESWQLAPLKSIARLLSGGTPSKERLDWWKGNIPWISPKDLKKPRLNNVEDYITHEALNNGSCLAPAKTIFIVVRGMVLAKDIPLAIAEIPMAFNQDLKGMSVNPGYNPEYIYRAVVWRKSSLSRAIGTSAHGTKRLDTSAIEELVLPMPINLKEQDAISMILTAAEMKATTLEKEIAILQEFFKAMLEELMTGQLSALPLIDENALAHNIPG